MASTISSVSPMRASIEAATSHISFPQGRLLVPPGTCLSTLLKQTLTNFTTNYDTHLPSSLNRILNSIFDTSCLAFVTEKEFRIEAGLEDHDSVTLFVQAVAEMAVVFERLLRACSSSASSSGNSDSGGLMTCLFSRELQLFAESEQRRTMLERIGGTSLLSHCYTKDEVVRSSLLPLKAVGEDSLSESVAWVSDWSCKNMGLPRGFTVMALN
ncbi:hypothetical protein QBC32DRAFT_400017 [Pseudoneurospora amorphoporcata]|uniref:Uncharacterized protein n=1 Tax=Pseudoneurospora amorphoporcata TaxID=241081 RepID=A0AAN6NRK3_9PEZI|nr:hypothetical protein QBC32DRAFT_400017 [Pseudoneurospora amorphoporcata]